MAQPNLIMDRGHDLIIMACEAAEAAEALLADASVSVRSRVAVDPHIIERVFVREQRAVHGLAWRATYVEAVRQLTPMPTACMRKTCSAASRGLASSS
jgi:hypothetical protein